MSPLLRPYHVATTADIAIVAGVALVAGVATTADLATADLATADLATIQERCAGFDIAPPVLLP